MSRRLQQTLPVNTTAGICDRPDIHGIIRSRVDDNLLHSGQSVCTLCRRGSTNTMPVDIDIQPGSPLKSGMAGSILRSETVAANIFDNRVFPQPCDIEPGSFAEIERLTTVLDNMPHRDGDRIVICAATACLPMNDRFGNCRRSRRCVIPIGIPGHICGKPLLRMIVAEARQHQFGRRLSMRGRTYRPCPGCTRQARDKRRSQNWFHIVPQKRLFTHSFRPLPAPSSQNGDQTQGFPPTRKLSARNRAKARRDPA